jgi:hypothetical protein
MEANGGKTRQWIGLADKRPRTSRGFRVLKDTVGSAASCIDAAMNHQTK